MKRLTIQQHNGSAIVVHRVCTKAEKLVYIMCTDKKRKYARARSRVVYIGTTSRGINRMTSSVAARAEKILSRGVNEFRVHVVTCKARKHLKTWHKLERALILAFRDLHGEVPKCNSHGKKMQLTNEFEYFSKTRLKTILENVS